jgi:hypothetical protein
MIKNPKMQAENNINGFLAVYGSFVRIIRVIIGIWFSIKILNPYPFMVIVDRQTLFILIFSCPSVKVKD